MKNNFKLPKDAGWLIPGLQIKRWLVIILTGAVLIAIGALILGDMQPIRSLMDWMQKLAKYVPSDVSGTIFILLGAFVFFKGWQYSNYSIMNLKSDREKGDLLEELYKRRKLNRGPRIVALGGGTGLSTLLKGIKNITNNITAIVTVGDDGGSSGRLREEFGILPPGDIRNCIAALADSEDLVTKLFQYRFKTGDGLGGHSFGNLFLSALCAITGDMVRAVKESSNVLSIRGRVIPSTLDDMKLVAELEDGRIIKGESNIPESGGKIKRIFTDPADCKVTDDILAAIANAELIILGPGSLFTSVIPNLLVKEISEALSKSKAKKIYVCNIMSQPGETDGYKVSDHIQQLINHAGSKNIIDAVLVNKDVPANKCEEYAKNNQFPVEKDYETLKKMGIQVVEKNLFDENQKGVKHTPYKVARAIYYWFRRGR